MFPGLGHQGLRPQAVGGLLRRRRRGLGDKQFRRSLCDNPLVRKQLGDPGLAGRLFRWTRWRFRRHHHGHRGQHREAADSNQAQ